MNMENTIRVITVILVGGALSILWFFAGCKYEELPQAKIVVLKKESTNNNNPLIRYIEHNNHEYILYRDEIGKGEAFSGMTHNPDCKCFKKDK